MAKYEVKVGDEFKELDLFTQDELNDVVQRRLKRSEEKYADYEDLKSRVAEFDKSEAKHKEEVEDMNAKIAEANTAVNAAKLETAKIRAMRDFNIKDDLGEFITGKTEDELRAKAEKLAHEIPSGQVIIEKTATPSGNTPKRSGSAEIAHQLFGKSDD